MKQSVINLASLFLLLACGAENRPSVQSDLPTTEGSALAQCEPCIGNGCARESLQSETEGRRADLYAVTSTWIYVAGINDRPCSANATCATLDLWVRSKDGSAGERLIQWKGGPLRFPDALVADEQAVYWVDSNTNSKYFGNTSIYRLDHGSSSPTKIYDLGENYVFDMVLDGDRLIYTDENAGEIKALARGRVTTLANLGATWGRPQKLRVQGDYVYFVENGYQFGDRSTYLRRVPRAGGAIETITSGRHKNGINTATFAVDSVSAYYMGQEHRLLRNPLASFASPIVQRQLAAPSEGLAVTPSGDLLLGEVTNTNDMSGSLLNLSTGQVLDGNCRNGAANIQFDGCAVYYTCGTTYPQLYRRALPR